ncbi:class II aldolase/adducin family protein [Bordetella hinzii]|uniref:Class II aldolase n=2 Tax=Bordetella hinzii TaxID=103855 RepID=A0AAN1VHF1_9BORD|nr:class II aldolase/adducin family protein [Bordetella hinzii]AKQ55434.1 Decarboxylase NovR [Bordetella hinzii]AKQ59935.1 Decarboxylase NovR [Bordetella hinzii]AZW18956.1 class II aldolase [Bordetella hinzii]KCB23052.1 class II aldolase/adducin N-terminal domain protein [Bordetella hinzii L60]KCB24168.1 class II aldolase/adducin N-terminal domain protein [Bordetella hinzii OH87 BAL007II]
MADNTGAHAPFSEREWAARVDLAACYRLVDHYDMCDMIYNHISARAPDDEEAFLINPFGLMYEEITASSLLKVDIEGNILYNPWQEYSINKAGYVIHSAIHAARPEIGCVIHTHTPDGMAISALECGLLPITQTAMRFGKVAYHDYEGVAVDEDERERLVRDLGDAEVMILKNHGLLAVGRTVQEAFNNIYRLERACRTQVKAMSCNSRIIIPEAQVIRKTNDQLRLQPSADTPDTRKPYGILEWPAMLRMLDRRDDSYRS